MSNEDQQERPPIPKRNLALFCMFGLLLVVMGGGLSRAYHLENDAQDFVFNVCLVFGLMAFAGAICYKVDLQAKIKQSQVDKQITKAVKSALK